MYMSFITNSLSLCCQHYAQFPFMNGPVLIYALLVRLAPFALSVFAHHPAKDTKVHALVCTRVQIPESDLADSVTNLPAARPAPSIGICQAD